MNDQTRAWLELTRISNLPTILSSAMVGTVFLGGWSFLTGLSFAHFILPTVAICLFYIAGFIFLEVDQMIGKHLWPKLIQFI